MYRDEPDWMTYSESLSAKRTFASIGGLWPFLLAIAILIAYIPTFITLAEGPWQTEQEGHGPLIIAASTWLVWQSRDRLRTTPLSPAPLLGWLLLLGGRGLLVLVPHQHIWCFAVASEITALAG